MARRFNETFKPPCCIHLANPMTLPSSSPGWSHVARHGHHNPILTNFWPVLSSLYLLPSLHHPISKPLHFRRPGLALTLPLAADNFPFSHRKRRPSLAAPRPPGHLRDILSSCAQGQPGHPALDPTPSASPGTHRELTGYFALSNSERGFTQVLSLTPFPLTFTCA